MYVSIYIVYISLIRDIYAYIIYVDILCIYNYYIVRL